jgi:sec-independent protein translocase protein TatB
MFDIGFSEVLLIAIAALVAIGPKDMPQALFRLGRMMRQVRIVMNGFRDQYSQVMHDVEVEHYRKEFGQIERDANEMKPLPKVKDDQPGT